MTHEDAQKHFDELTADLHHSTMDGFKVQWAIFRLLLEASPRAKSEHVAHTAHASHGKLPRSAAGID